MFFVIEMPDVLTDRRGYLNAWAAAGEFKHCEILNVIPRFPRDGQFRYMYMSYIYDYPFTRPRLPRLPGEKPPKKQWIFDGVSEERVSTDLEDFLQMCARLDKESEEGYLYAKKKVITVSLLLESAAGLERGRPMQPMAAISMYWEKNPEEAPGWWGSSSIIYELGL